MPGKASHRQPTSAADVARGVARASAHESRIVAAYVFGSVARGTATSLSDIDVALMLTPGSAPADVCGRVADELSRQFGTDRVDVVSLDHAPAPLAYRVIREGRLVVCRDAARIERFVADTVLHYLDFQPLRDRAFRLLRSKILDTGDGR
jgi:hypothetical protein